MAEERIVETADGTTTTTRTVDTPTTTVIERRGGGGGIAIAIVLLLAVLVGGYYLFARQGAENRKDAAITSAAKSVGDTADKVGSAVEGAAK